MGEAQDGEASASWKKDLVAGAIAVAAAGAIVANAAFLQKGQHPAPLFAAKPSAAPASAPKSPRVVGQELTGPPLPGYPFTGLTGSAVGLSNGKFHERMRLS